MAWTTHSRTPSDITEAKLWTGLTQLANELARRGKYPNEDAAGDALLGLVKAFQNTPYQGKARFSTWAVKIIKKSIALHDRKLSAQKRKGFSLEGLPNEDSQLITDAGSKIEAQEKSQAIQAVLDKLSDRERQVIEKYLEGKKSHETAKELNLPERTVESYWEYALKRVRDGLL